MKKIIIIALALIAVLVLAPLAYFAYCDTTMGGKEDEATAAYLVKHRLVVDANDIKIPESFGSKIKTGKGQVMILGEIHGFSPTQLMDARLLNYLNENKGVRIYCAEIYSEVAEQLNEILIADSLDEKRLTEVIQEIAEDTPQNKTTDYMNKWKEIFNHNHTASASHKIHVVGLLGSKKDYANEKRDATMARTLLAFVNDPANAQLVQNGCYCFVGLTHAFQSPYLINGHEVATFGSLLKEHRMGVTSMVQLAIDSYCYLPKNGEMPSPPDEATKLVSSIGPISYINNIVNLEKASKGGIETAIYELNAEGSPFKGRNDLVGIKASLPIMAQPYEGLPGRSTTDYFQWVFLIRDRQAPKPL